MRIERFEIGTIPAILYGEPGKKGYLFLHGQMGRKEEVEAFARVACPKGFQVLAIDLPGHGQRQERGEEFAPWTAVPDIRAAWDWAALRWKAISLRANSIGAYFAMLALDVPCRALLVSPILDMEGLILAMMGKAGVTESRLREEGEIETGSGPTLSWEYLCWVRQHPSHVWGCPVRILYGSKDDMTPWDTVQEYAHGQGAKVTLAEGAGHWFHTPEELALLKKWEETEL